MEKAKLLIKNKDGIIIHEGTTPTTLSLRKKASFFNPEQYTLFAEKDGYFSTTRSLNAGISWWYAGNIIFGGLIGLLIVDPATGAMWSFDEKVHLNLEKK